MIKVTVIAGLPGSGKTYLARQLAAQYNAVVFDDFLTQRGMWEQVKAAIGGGISDHLILTDPKLCSADIREELVTRLLAVKLDLGIEWIFFENNPAVCWHNICDRGDERLVTYNFLTNLSKQYSIFDETAILPCYEPKT